MSTTMIGDQPWHVDLPRSTRGLTIAGMVVMATTIMGFGVWGGTAPIAGAVVASGVFVATGQNKTVQHLEGGMIRDIMVHEGDTVEAGQILVELDQTTAKAEMQRLFLRDARLTAVDSRLQAQVREEPEVHFPPQLTADSKDPQIRSIVSSQILAFTAQRNNTNSEIAGIEDSINALNERIAGSKVQLDGVRRQIALVEEDIKTKEHLLAAGLVRKPDVLLLQRNQANLEGEVGRIMGDIGDSKERIARAVEQINGVRKTAIKTAVEQMHEIRGEMVDVRERMLSAKGVLDRTTIRAPVKGVVVKLRFHTRGGVVEPGKPIMELLPLNEPLIIEARVRPQDIDSVKHGQEAMVRLTALSQRVTPMVSGDVIYLSADTVADEKKSQQTGPSDIYVIRVRLHNSEVAAIHGFNPTPGMPAEVFVKTSERTFFQYIMKPIEDSMSRAFRER
jgi:HlyD family secretion protein